MCPPCKLRKQTHLHWSLSLSLSLILSRRKSKSGDVLKVHYVGTLYKNGKQFDSSRKREEPFQFTLGQNQVIKGWEHGLQNMCINETRKLVIPSEMAYGTVGTPLDVGANATLAYVVELLDIL